MIRLDVSDEGDGGNVSQLLLLHCEAALQLVSSFDSDFTLHHNQNLISHIQKSKKRTWAFIIATTETTMAMVERTMSKAPMMIVPDLRLVQPKHFFRRSSGSIIASSISKLGFRQFSNNWEFISHKRETAGRRG